MTQQQYFSLEITNDMIREDNENFFLDLMTHPGEMLDRVTISPAVAEVTINEDDRESSRDLFPPHNQNFGTMYIAVTV